MSKNENITRLSPAEAAKRRANHEGRTDFARRDTADEVERHIASDPDLFVPADWDEALIAGIPELGREAKTLVSVRYSPRVLRYFKSTGRGWQTRMDAVLTAYVEQQERKQR